eukprot:TRINITY_DN37665_c0_g2_i2.p1 TRINITY_DN37665_c0_g2~~TRINITY_DN37665_c0_g2_i2.p1  ORF type:complete len:294 (-),score=31.95 TRINITY_DN37665_c0_g2_i2:259-1140(-)
MKQWLWRNAYPLVNRLGPEFPVRKYFDRNRFGLVLVVKPLGQMKDDFMDALEPLAKQYQERLKFTMLAGLGRSASISDTSVLDRYGILTDDEVLIVEKPSESPVKRGHSNRANPPKYRMENATIDRIRNFFEDYERGQLKRYYVSAAPYEGPVIKDGIRHLSGWDFEEVVGDPSTNALVMFTSANCEGCISYWPRFKELTKHITILQKRKPNPFPSFVMATMNQTANEHREVVEGTPCLRLYSSGKRKRKWELMKPDGRSHETAVAWLEDIALELSEGHEDVPRRRGRGNGDL